MTWPVTVNGFSRAVGFRDFGCRSHAQNGVTTDGDGALVENFVPFIHGDNRAAK